MKPSEVHNFLTDKKLYEGSLPNIVHLLSEKGFISDLRTVGWLFFFFQEENSAFVSLIIKYICMYSVTEYLCIERQIYSNIQMYRSLCVKDSIN